MSNGQKPWNLISQTLKTLYLGENRSYRIRVLKVVEGQVTDQPEDLTGATVVTWTLREEPNAGGDPAMQKTLGDGVAVDTGPGGTAIVTVDTTDSTGLTVPHTHHWDVRVVLAGGLDNIVAVGTLPVRDPVF